MTLDYSETVEVSCGQLARGKPHFYALADGIAHVCGGGFMEGMANAILQASGVKQHR